MKRPTDIANIGVGSYWVFFVDSSKDCWYKVDLVVSCEEDCEFRTQTQGGWGAPPNGNNPAKYLQNNFVSCFPNGVTIGCAGGEHLDAYHQHGSEEFPACRRHSVPAHR